MQKYDSTNIPDLDKFTQQIMESSDDLITVVDRQGAIIVMNPAVGKLFGINPEEVIGTSLVQTIYGGRKFDYQGNYLSPLIETLETGKEMKNKETTVKSPLLNSLCFCKTTTGVLRDQSGRLAGAYSYTKDLTQSRNLERTNENLKDMINAQQLQTILAFSEAIGARDDYTRGHSERVAEYAQMIAAAMGLGDLNQLVYVAALVHDVGKIGIPEAILNKPAKLTDAEFQRIQEHTVTGANILKRIYTFSNLVSIVRAHHERYDGKGYPDGLAGEEIPLISRIIAVADSFEAMTSDRSYRKRFSIEYALEELKRCAGSQFDPVVVEHFVEMVSSTDLDGSEMDRI